MSAPSPDRWRTTRFDLDLRAVHVMGIVNITPDSFFDGGRWFGSDAARRQCDRLVAEGAHLLDLGAESTRPGAAELPPGEEIERLMPVLQHALTLGVPVSVDTRHAEVMRAALDAGADIINDIFALRGNGALEVLAAFPRAGACLMHMQGTPADMQHDPRYADVVAEVRDFLAQRLAAAQAAGIATERLVIDPGYGFGKTAAHNWQLLSQQAALSALGRPLLAGVSRKSMLGAVTGRAADERLVASVVAMLGAVEAGARVLRVHDVAASVDALRVWQALGRCVLADKPQPSEPTVKAGMPHRGDKAADA